MFEKGLVREARLASVQLNAWLGNGRDSRTERVILKFKVETMSHEENKVGEATTIGILGWRGDWVDFTITPKKREKWVILHSMGGESLLTSVFEVSS